MKYSEVATQIYKESFPILKRYWFFFLGISGLYHLYGYLIFRFVKLDAAQLSYVISTYHVLVFPVIVLIIMYLVDCLNHNKSPKDFTRLMLDAKRCYFRILLIYLTMELIRRYFGVTTSLIIFFIMYMKLPFLEQEVFFENSSLWKAVKRSYELANRLDVVKFIAILVILLAVGYSVIKKVKYIVLGADIGHVQMIMASISVIGLAFFLFFKAVLTKIYTMVIRSY